MNGSTTIAETNDLLSKARKLVHDYVAVIDENAKNCDFSLEETHNYGKVRRYMK
jgi:hypothetical protein